jgi:pantoate kinase
MVDSAVAFCPGHISGYFRRVKGTSVQTTGSIGAGIVISAGVEATAVPADQPQVQVREVNRAGFCSTVLTASPPIAYVMDRLGVTAAVTTVCTLPIGAGFGLSAAALLSATAALNALYDLGLSTHQVTALAHEAEIVHQTGLGDVAACQGGGLVCREGPGPDGTIARLHDPMAGSLCAVTFGPLPTPAVLQSGPAMAAVEAAFPARCPDSLVDFFHLSRQFAERSGLITPEVRHALSLCDRAGVPASMTMLGNGVFALGDSAVEVLLAVGEPFHLEIASGGFSIQEHVS